MKCIRCQKDCTYPERRGTRQCPHCKGKFAFEPREGDAVSDATFLASIQAVSGHGKLRFNARHLYYELCRRFRPKRAPRALVMVFTLISVCMLALVIGLFIDWKPIGPWAVFAWPIFFLMLIITLIMLASRLKSSTVRLSETKFDSMMQTWTVIHGAPAGLLPKPERSRPAPLNLEADVADYSFDRAVIVDRAATAAFLIANQFHFENNCAILSIDGYPDAPFETVRAMLKRNPDLRVFLLHDASFKGCDVARIVLSDPQWFADDPPRIIDVGLRPRHAQDPFFDGLMLDAHDRSDEEVPGVPATEVGWLRKYNLEVEAYRPEQIIKRLFGSIQREEQRSRAEQNETVNAANDGGLAVFPVFIPLGGSSNTSDEQQKQNAAAAGAGSGGEVIIDDQSFSGNDATTVDGGGDSFG